MIEVTDIDGIGPAKADTLAEEGFDSLEAIATAEEDILAEVEGVGESRALEFIVQAQNLSEDFEETQPEDNDRDEFDLTPSEIDEEDLEEDVDESEDESEDESNDESDNESDDESVDSYDVDIEFSNSMQFHTFHTAIMNRLQNVYSGRQESADALDNILNQVNSFENITFTLTEKEFNELHSAITQQVTTYQGNNLIGFMDELREVADQISEQRNELLF